MSVDERQFEKRITGRARNSVMPFDRDRIAAGIFLRLLSSINIFDRKERDKSGVHRLPPKK